MQAPTGSNALHWIDLVIFVLYMAAMLGIGVWFYRQNKNADDFYVGGRKMGSLHIGLSVVATDVGGGFSIGLGGLGFVMGLSGSWMLFTGLLGAWLAAVLLIPRVRKLTDEKALFTFPEIFGRLFNGRVAIVAGLISGIGYLGFTAAQMLAGAKLASASFVALEQSTALWIMGVLIVVYTVLGGLKAVIFTDTIQWAILMLGLVFIGIPLGYSAIGGWQGLTTTLGPEFLALNNLRWQDFINWLITILPIWFVGMTLYQRIYACRDEKTAKRAWFLAGLFEWPVMAFMGVLLGLFARVATAQGMFDYLGAEAVASLDAEKGLPMLLRTILPVGLMGLMLSAYFSAILSTADSCLMAASGNFSTDLLGKYLGWRKADKKRFLQASQLVTLVLGGVALLLATAMQSVLDLMLHSYAFMVSGLLVPLVGALFWKRKSSTGALVAMLLGGLITVSLTAGRFRVAADANSHRLEERVQQIPPLAAALRGSGVYEKPPARAAETINDRADTLKIIQPTGKGGFYFRLPFGLDPNFFGILAAALSYLIFLQVLPDTPSPKKALAFAKSP